MHTSTAASFESFGYALALAPLRKTNPAGMQLPLATKLLAELAELVEATGPDSLCSTSSEDAESKTPILELCFGEINTKTWLAEEQDVAYLVVAIALPRSSDSAAASQVSLPRMQVSAPLESEVPFWNADAGAHVVFLRKSLAHLDDERSLLDTILDAVDEARAWHADVSTQYLATVPVNG